MITLIFISFILVMVIGCSVPIVSKYGIKELVPFWKGFLFGK